MSVYEIPFHLQEEIMKRLPVKSLIQFRIVSKAWKSLIDSSQFIAAHSLYHHRQPYHLLVSYEHPPYDINYVCFIDDETLFQQRSVAALPLSIKQIEYPKVVGSSHGLLCLYGFDRKSTTYIAVILNPLVRKSIAVVVPKTPYAGERFVGFGVCPVTTDPKIVAIKQPWNRAYMEISYQCEVMVYSLSSGIWRSLSTNLPTKPLRYWHQVVAADGFIYWLGALSSHNMIISFDVTNENFEMIDLPTNLAHHARCELDISKLRESLVILQYHISTYTIWIMEGDVQRFFTKLFTIHATVNSLVGFRKSGVPIVKVTEDKRPKLVVYEPNSEHNNVLEVSLNTLFYSLDSCMETLLLFDRSDSSSY